MMVDSEYSLISSFVVGITKHMNKCTFFRRWIFGIGSENIENIDTDIVKYIIVFWIMFISDGYV